MNKGIKIILFSSHLNVRQKVEETIFETKAARQSYIAFLHDVSIVTIYGAAVYAT